MQTYFNSILIEIGMLLMFTCGQTSLLVVNVIWVDLTRFTLIFHFFSQFCKISRWWCSLSKALTRSEVSSVNVAISNSNSSSSSSSNIPAILYVIMWSQGRPAWNTTVAYIRYHGNATGYHAMAVCPDLIIPALAYHVTIVLYYINNVYFQIQ
jgi:hypothetical protein